jgi:hypothetical protein
MGILSWKNVGTGPTGVRQPTFCHKDALFTKITFLGTAQKTESVSEERQATRTGNDRRLAGLDGTRRCLSATVPGKAVDHSTTLKRRQPLPTS